MKYLTFLILTFAMAIPAFAGHGYGQAQQIVGHNGNVIVVSKKQVEIDGKRFLGLNNYYSVKEEIKQDRMSQYELLLQRQQAQIEVLIRLLAAQKGVSPGVENPKPSHPPIQPTQPVQPVAPTPAPVPPTVKPSDIDTKVYNIFKKNCASCHGGKSFKRLRLIDEEKGQLFGLTLAQRVDVFDRVNGVGTKKRGKKTMPIGSNLPDTDVAILREWMFKKADQELNLQRPTN